MKVINLTCSRCGGELQFDEDKKQAYCPYCGAKLLIDDDNAADTASRIADEVRLKEAEVRLKELEYGHERELREETIRQEQKRSERIGLIVFIALLAASYTLSSLRSYSVLLLVFGIIYLTGIRSSDRKAAAQQPGYSQKSKVTALILCIFFGEFGVHYFYAGRIIMGIVYLFTLGFFGIGWFIDIIRIACGTFRDRWGNYIR